MSRAKKEKKTKIVEVAIETIRKQGIKKTTLEDIARESGMAITSMYYYFSNKNELLRSALSMLWDKGFAEIEEVAKASLPPEEKLLLIWKAVFVALNKSGVLIDLDRRARSQLAEMVEEFVDDFSRKYRAMVENILREGLEKQAFQVHDIEMAATVLSSGIWGILLSTIEHGRIEITEEWIDELASLLMYGLKKRKE